MACSPQPTEVVLKGVVFTEFLELVEDAFGLDVVDRIIEVADTPTAGAFTSVGTYDHSELIALVGALSVEVDTPVVELLHTFGKHLFGVFVHQFPELFEGVQTALQFVMQIEEYIHVEVRKLYPDAELPTFEHEVLEDGSLELTYTSTRPFSEFARGLLMGCVEHFGGGVEVEVQEDSSATSALFRLWPVSQEHNTAA